MANIITTLALEMNANWYVQKKLNSVGRVGENTVTKLTIEPTEILDNVTYEIEIADASGSKNVAELTIDGTELYLILTANMLTVSGIMKMQVRAVFEDGSIKKSNIFELKVNRSISATDYYEEYAVTIFDQLVAECRDIIEGAESYAVRAETAAVNAEAYEQSASASAQAASTSEATATSASTAAVNAAASAETSANTASASAETATTAAASASASATTATSASETAQAASTAAQTASTTAVNASTAATTAASNAETSATTATTAANNASASATAASTSASNAATSETNASASATNAHTSETNAATSATNAANSASSASASATNAANSATSAATSASNAHTSEVNASTSETNASASATEAAEAAETVASSIAQINENTYRINDLEAIIGGYQLTDLPTGEVASITNGTALLMPSLKIGIEPVQEGSGDPSPENIRPISGWTAANVTRTGKNLWNPNTINDGKTLGADGNLLNNNTRMTSDYIKVNTGSIYLTNVLGSGLGRACATYDKYKNFVRIITISSTGVTSGAISINDGETYIRVSTEKGAEVQVEYGSTATTYEPYNGTTYNIQFKDGDNPLTVYGGTLDVTTGELVVDRVMVDLGTLDWTYYTGASAVAPYFYTDIRNLNIKYEGDFAINVHNLICSRYESSVRSASSFINGKICADGNNTQQKVNQIQIKDSSYSDATAFKTAMNGVQLVYELATPLTYHLTPTQVRTLVGNNNIWADTGDVLSGKYFRSLS